MRILVADDDEIGRRVLTKRLESLGHEVIAAPDGEEAWRLYSAHPTPVVITDWEMAPVDGLELTERIRDARFKFYPWIILLTARDYLSNVKEAVRAGVDDFLEKPGEMMTLRARLAVAQRVSRLNAQLSALANALPVCVKCKSIRNNSEWQRLETFLHEASGIEMSHGYCPDCYYQFSLQPEVVRWRELPATPATSATEVLDAAVLDSLRRFEREGSPDLVDDLVEGLQDAIGRIGAELDRFDPMRSSSVRKHLDSLAERAADVGAGKLMQAARTLARLSSRATPGESVRAVRQVQDAMAATLMALKVSV